MQMLMRAYVVKDLFGILVTVSVIVNDHVTLENI